MTPAILRADTGIHDWCGEYRFAAHHVGLGPGLRDRLRAAGLQDWRFDLCSPSLMIAVEIEGGAWTGGRHTRGAGFSGDLRKYAAAQRLGWTIIRTDYAMIRSGEAYTTIRVVAARIASGRPPPGGLRGPLLAPRHRRRPSGRR